MYVNPLYRIDYTAAFVVSISCERDQKRTKKQGVVNALMIVSLKSGHQGMANQSCLQRQSSYGSKDVSTFRYLLVMNFVTLSLRTMPHTLNVTCLHVSSTRESPVFPSIGRYWGNDDVMSYNSQRCTVIL